MVVEIVCLSTHGVLDDVFLRSSGETSREALALRWSSDSQQFVVCDEGEASWLPQGGRGAREVSSIRCKCVFGVLALGTHHSALVYVSQATPVLFQVIDGSASTTTALPLQFPNAVGCTVMRIDQMKYLLLPMKVPTSNPDSFSSASPSDVPSSGARSPTPAMIGCLSKKALQEYLDVLGAFVRCSSYDEGVHFYYANRGDVEFRLAQDSLLSKDSADDPAALPPVADTPCFSSKHHNPHRHTPAGGPQRRALTSEACFQWNRSLLEAFPASAASSSNSSCSTEVSVRDQQGVAVAGGSLAHKNVVDVFAPSIIRGYVGGYRIQTSSGIVSIILCCRLSSVRAGTRYNRRGIDTISGVAANFSETTQYVFTEDRSTQFAILRGSIPRCWQQPANLTFKPTITISSDANGEQEVRSHLRSLTDLYGSAPIHCVDTTSTSALEDPLSQAFVRSLTPLLSKKCVSDANADTTTAQRAATTSPSAGSLPQRILYTKFNIGHKMKSTKTYAGLQEELLSLLEPSIHQFGFTACASSAVEKRQDGMFRVNCLDCLDRTNLVQSMIALVVAAKQIEWVLNASSSSEALCTVAVANYALRQLWGCQGVVLAGLYAGSEPHFLDLLLRGKHTFRSLISSGSIALRRFVQQNFWDGRKQDAVSLLTRAHSTVPASASANPFERRVTNYNRFVVAALGIATLSLMINFAFMLSYERYRFRMDFVAFQVSWLFLLLMVVWKIRKDPHSYCSFPVLK